jgi:AMP phosphorylase
MIWGGALDLAPADDVLIHVEKGIHLESYQKILVSIVAKKIAMGISHIVLDIPYGKGTKVQNPDDVQLLKKEFVKLFAKVGIECEVYTRVALGPDGNSIGPNLEMKETLLVLEQDEKRSRNLEKLIVDMAGMLLEMVGKASKGQGSGLAQQKLASGEALEKFWEIAKAQGADKVLKATEIPVGQYTFDVIADKGGKVKMINNRELVKIARALGTPTIKDAGLYVHKMVGDSAQSGEVLTTLYAPTQARLESGKKEIDLASLYEIS